MQNIGIVYEIQQQYGISRKPFEQQLKTKVIQVMRSLANFLEHILLTINKNQLLTFKLCDSYEKPFIIQVFFTLQLQFTIFSYSTLDYK